MSEFRQASAHVDALEARLALLQAAVGGIGTDASVDEALRFILTATDGDTDTMMDRFRERCSMLDPVTQQPRFGPKMLAKVQDMLRRYDDVKLAVEDGAPLRQQVEAKSEQLAQVQAEREKEQADRKREAREAERAAELARAHEQERLQQEALARDAEQRRLEQVRIDALAAAANKKRERRELERVQEERLRLEEEERRARLNALIPLGKEGLERSIAMLRESTGDATRFRQSMEKLLAVVGNICSSPENAAFRHIPKENAHFHADLGQYEGGYQCLLALGFRELQQGDDNEPKLVFVLEEPDLSEDLDAWSDWFEGLKSMKELVESKL